MSEKLKKGKNMDKKEHAVFSGLLLSLLEIMEESNDPTTRDRLDEEIKEVMKELNLTWEDIG
ncbi:hypothetical protein ABLV90_01865 [Staphylococcus sp. 2S1]